MKSISSLIMEARRLDRLLKIAFCTCSFAPFKAIARSELSTSRSTLWIARSSSSRISSKTNIFLRISSASSGSSISSDSMICFSVPLSTVFKISTTASTPPITLYSWLTSDASFVSSTRSTSLMTSGLVLSIVAIRIATSACLSGGSAEMICAACPAGR